MHPMPEPLRPGSGQASSPAQTPSPGIQDPFDQRLELARKLADEHRFADAIVLFGWLCEAYPNRAAAVVDSANTYARVHDYTGVMARFGQIESRPPVPTDVWIAMAGISQRLRRPQWSRRFFTNSIAAPSAEACGRFAIYLEHGNDLDQAAEMFTRGLKIDSGNAPCQLAKARVLRRQRAFEQSAATVHVILNNPATDDRTKISALYEQAHLNDAQGDYGGAIQSLLAAKNLTSRQSDFEMFQQRAIAVERNHHRFLTTLNAGYFKAAGDWTPASPHRIALLGGHPRSGTTLLEQVLDAHSGIISAEETMVFAGTVNDPLLRDLTGPDVCTATLNTPVARIEQLRYAYFSVIEQVLDQPLAGRFLVDKNPSITDCIPVFARVFPEASFIIALRDPRDVVLSCFFQDLPANEVTVHFQTLKETAMRYANTMAMWLLCRENMDEKKWIEVRYESLVSDLPGEAQKLMSKLNLDWQPAQSHPHHHARSRPVISPTYADVAQPVHQRAVGKWKRYEPWLIEAMPILETFLDAFEY
jgi:tetratricopeptide (TPR) repeat protein